MDHPVPQNLEAERAVLGACLTSRRALGEALELVSNDDWYRPAHEMPSGQRSAAGRPQRAGRCDHRREKLTEPRPARRTGGARLPAHADADVATATNVGYYARIVAASAVRRRLIEALTRSPSVPQPGADLDQLLEDAQARRGRHRRTRWRRSSGVHTWHEFLKLHANQQQNWVIPG
jgi:replicative DNA helicase